MDDELPTDYRAEGLPAVEIKARLANRIRVRVHQSSDNLPTEGGTYMFHLDELPETVLEAMGLDPAHPAFDDSTKVYKFGIAPSGLANRSRSLSSINELGQYTQEPLVLICYVTGLRATILKRFECALKRALLEYRLPVGGSDFERYEFVYPNAGEEQNLIDIFEQVASEFIWSKTRREVALARHRTTSQRRAEVPVIDLADDPDDSTRYLNETRSLLVQVRSLQVANNQQLQALQEELTAQQEELTAMRASMASRAVSQHAQTVQRDSY